MFYRERSTIEKEYATKLSALSSKYFEKKARNSTLLSVGDNPTVTPGSLESASLVAWSEVLNQTEQISKERHRTSTEFNVQIAEQIGGIAMRLEDIRNKYSVYHEKLITDRGVFYSDLKKSKSTYDTSCEAMEAARMKASKSFDRAKDKAGRKLNEKELIMNNDKNDYLIKINIANRIKDKYYHEDVPELLDHLQQLNEVRVRMVNDFWTQAINVEKANYDRSKVCLDSIQQVVNQNIPTLDSVMFVKHNIGQWTEPSDFIFQESPIWHDDEKMITSGVPLQYLRTRLEQAHNKFEEHSHTSESRMESYRTLQEQKKSDLGALDSGKISKASYIDNIGRSLAALQAVTYNETAKTVSAVEIETIEVAAGDKDLASVAPIAQAKKRKGLRGLLDSVTSSGGSASHSRHHSRNIQPSRNDDDDFDNDLKSIKSMSIASTKGSSGGLLSSFKHGIRKRSGTVNSTTSDAAHSMGHGGSNGSGQSAKMIYGYTAQQDGELTVVEGEELALVSSDDGTGWLICRKNTGQEGLVPASYAEIVHSIQATPSIASVSTTTTSDSRNTSSKKKGPTVAPKRGAKKIRYMIALYDYDAQTDEEITVRQGDKIMVIEDDSGDGWTEGELNGMSGIFPTAYAKDID